MNATGQRLLVPIHLDAVVINKNSSRWKNLGLSIDNLDKTQEYKGLGYFIEKPAGTSPVNSFYQDGIHLHWILPASLRHGRYDEETNSLEFPLVPNRWLVVRADEKLQMKSWIVESDFMDDTTTAGRNWISQHVQAGELLSIKPVKIGRVHAFDNWVETNIQPLFLTALAPGNPDFASSYMHCKDVFGFYDDMKDAEGTRFSYKVYGWYSNASVNPLAEINGKDSFLKKLGTLNWLCEETDKLTDDTVPGDILCHGNANEVLWSPEVTSSVPSISDIKVAVGNSSAEALASLLRDKATGDQLPKLLVAYQYKLLSENGIKEDSLALLQKQMHSKSFETVNGGTYWTVERKERNLLPDDKEQQPPEDSLDSFPETLSQLLLNINIQQQRYDNGVNELKSLQEQLYALHFKKLYSSSLEAPLGALDKASKNEIRARIDKDIAAIKTRIDSLRQDIRSLKTRVDGKANWPDGWRGEIADTYKNLLQTLADESSKIRDYIIKEVPSDVFFKPADPAVVIDGLNPSVKYKHKGAIRCRTSTQVIAVFNTGYLDVKGTDIADKKMISSLSEKVPSEVKSLLYESLLIDPLSVNRMVDFINGSQRKIYDRNEIFNKLTSAIAQFANRDHAPDFLREDNTLALTPPGFSAMKWEQPWTPLFLEWGIAWSRTYGTLAGDAPLKHWNFGQQANNIEFLQGATPSIKNNLPEYYGRTILSDTLVNKLDDLNKLVGGVFGSVNPMAQTLSGLYNQLLMRYPGIQLPFLKEGIPDADIMKYIDAQSSWRPITDALFQPLRAGYFRLTTLRVIDSFGQVFEIINEKTAASPGKELLISSPALTPLQIDAKNYFRCAPRIVQPVRIKFEWMSAAQKSRPADSDPTTSPVCGWLLHNQMDHSICVFDARGMETGELRKVNERVAFIPSAETGVAGMHTILESVVNFVKSDTTIFDQFLKHVEGVNTKVEQKVSRQSLTMKLPIGFPVAIATARCMLQLKDLAAQNQSWNPDAANTDFSNLSFPLCIGNANRGQDGLVGIFFREILRRSIYRSRARARIQTLRQVIIPWCR